MIENANHYLLSAFTGTINHCSILVTRYIRSKIINKAVILEDRLNDFIEVLTNKEVSFENDFGLIETEKVRSFREQNPDSTIFQPRRFEILSQFVCVQSMLRCRQLCSFPR